MTQGTRKVEEEHWTNVLLKAGWWLSDDGWRHKNLVWPWSTTAAAQLQREADEGRADFIHRMLRGEER